MTCSVAFKKFCLTLLIFCYHNISKANGQTPRGFNERFQEVSNNLIVNDLIKARRVADSLVKASTTDEQKLRSHLLLAKVLNLEGDIKQSLFNALKADTISNSLISSPWIAVTSCYLSSAYRHLGLFKTATTYLEKAEKHTNKLNDKYESTLTYINILHNSTFLNIDKKNFQLAKTQAQKAFELLPKVEELDNEVILLHATTFKILGICEYNLGNLEDADSLLNASLGLLQHFDCTLKPFIYCALAEVALQRDEKNKALKYLDKIDKYLQNFDAEELKILSYRIWLKYYKIQDDFPKYLFYNSRLETIERNKNKNKIDVLDGMIHDYKENIDKSNALNKHIFITITSILFILFSLIIILIPQYRLLKIKQESSPKNKGESKNNNHNSLESVIKGIQNINISKETTERLYLELLYQEKICFFLNSNITLQDLAKEMGTNSRYVTYVLNEFRGMSYYSYLQSIRINYIKDRMIKSPKLLNLKIRELATMSGFASPSKFSVAFKEETGETPTIFINKLKEQNKRKKQQ